jgi:hypothetical protein
MTDYYVYTWDNLGHGLLSRLRQVGEIWGIEGWQTMTKAQLRRAIMTHPKNLSPVPHPLIEVPVELTGQR